MAGWQRIGVVISVLWLIGPPTYLFIDTNMRANQATMSCSRAFNELAWKFTREGKRAEADEADRERAKCGEHQGHMTLGQALNLLVKGDLETLIVWAPVALLWILGGIIFATVRWVKRGFATS
jgi:hypothetical protein